MISVALQRGSTVYVYNEKNIQIFSRNGELYGYTSNSVSIKRNNTVYIYNERGIQTSNHFVKE